MDTKQYIGLDAHSSTCTFCVINEAGTITDTRTIVTNGRFLVDYVSSLSGTIELALEECDISAWLFDILHTHVKKIIVCDPVENRQYKRAKTDKLDAHNLAQLLRGGFLHPVFHDGSEREKFRILMSSYQDTVMEITRIKNRFRAISRRTQHITKSSKIHREDIVLIKNITEQQITVLTESKKKYTARIRESLKQFPEAVHLMSIPGIAHIQAAKIIAQVINPRRFSTKYKFFAYCGLVRHARMSAHKYYGSKRIWGNRTLKCVYKMAAQSALLNNNVLKIYYTSLCARGITDRNARNALARKIAMLSLTLWRKKERFKEQKILKSLPSCL